MSITLGVRGAGTFASRSIRLFKRAVSPITWRLPHEARRYLFRISNPAGYRYYQEFRRKVAIGDDFSCLPFDQNLCIFIHIPKCAGVSISMGLFGNLSGGHVSARLYSLVYAREEFESYFKFTFVRNPWDRLASGYYYIRDGSGLADASFDPELVARLREMLRTHPDFDRFVRGWVTTENINSIQVFQPQHSFICIHGRKPAVDFIGYYENLVNDYEYVRSRIRAGSELPWMNRSAKARHTELYSEDTRKIVEEVYADDIELFGYSFDNSSLDRQLALRGGAV